MPLNEREYKLAFDRLMIYPAGIPHGCWGFGPMTAINDLDYPHPFSIEEQLECG